MPNEIVLNEWYEFGVYFGFDCCCCVRKTVPKSAFFAQASRTRLGESYMVLVSGSARASRSGGVIWSYATGHLA